MKSITTVRIQTIDSIITYFETELNMFIDEDKEIEEKRRFLLNMFVLVFSTIMVSFSGASQIFVAQKNILLIIMSVLVILLCTVFLILITKDKSNYMYDIKRKISLQLILKYLLHLKATRIILNKYLGKLKEKIKKDFRDDRLYK